MAIGNRIVVAICSSTGPGSGKSTLAREFIERFNEKFFHRGARREVQHKNGGKSYPEISAEKFSFAQPLKEIVYKHLLGSSVNDDHKATPVTVMIEDDALPITQVRDFLIRIGTGGREVLGADVWAEALKQRVLDSQASVVVIDDMRYQSELDAIQPNIVVDVRGAFKEDQTHDCDAGFIKYLTQIESVVVVDNTTKESLAAAAQTLVGVVASKVK